MVQLKISSTLTALPSRWIQPRQLIFGTDDKDLAGIPGLFGEELAHWHAISRMLRKHWFHLTVKMIVKGRA
ncbi:hypothetical protein ABFV57_30890, partial [Pseudomonas neuropathica]